MANAIPALQAAQAATGDIPVQGTAVTDYGTAPGIEPWTGVTGYNISGTSNLTLNVDVQQVSGSTVTSSAFVDAVNNAITCYNEVKGAA